MGLTVLALWLAAPAMAQDAGSVPLVPDAGRPTVADAGSDAGADAGLVSARVVFRDSQPIRLWSDGGVVTHTFHLDEMGNARVEDVRLRATGLQDESGVSASPVELLDARDAGLGPVSLDAMGSVPVTLRASLDQPGTYRGRITLLHGGREQASTDVVITWPRSTLNVELAEPVLRVRGITSDGHVRIPLTLRETAGLPASLNPPVLTSLTLQEDPADTATAFNVPATARALLPDGGTVSADGFVLGRRQVLPVQLEIDSDLPGAGLYKGKVRITSVGGGAPLDASFVLYLRQSWGVAFVFIVVGVFVSFGIRTYQTSERPRMLLEYRAQTQLQALDDLEASPDCDDKGKELVRSLREQVVSVQREISRWQVPVDVEALGTKSSLLERKVTAARNWVRLYKAVLATRPEELQKDPLGMLETVNATLMNPGADAEAVKSAEDTLGALPGTLRQRVRDYLVKGIQSLRDKVKDAVKAAPDPRTATQLTVRVMPSLDRAEGALDRNPAEASRELDAARAAYATQLADELTTVLAGAPQGFMTPDAWTTLGADIKTLLAPLRAGPIVDPEAAVMAYEQSMTLYLRSVTTALLEKAKALPTGVLTETAKADLAGALTVAEHAVQLADEGKFTDAQREYKAALASYMKAENAPKAGAGVTMGAGGAPVPPAPAPAAVSLASLPETLSQSLRLGGSLTLEGRTPAQVMAWIGSRLWLTDFLVMLLTLALASLVGLKFLWVDDLIWGGWGDWLVALLWGFGLHQLVHPGIAPLIQRIIAPAQGTSAPAAPAPTPTPTPAPAPTPPAGGR